MKDNLLQFEKVATILLGLSDTITIQQLSIVSGLSTTELTEILKHFNSLGFLKNGTNFEKILLSEKAKDK